MKKIVVTQDMEFYPDQKKRLDKLGDVKYYNKLSKSQKEWLERCKGADIICTGKFGLKEGIYKLKDVFISLPFVAVGWIDKNKLKKNNITVAYSPGCNKEAVSEWIIAMMLYLLRKLSKYVNATNLPKGKIPKFDPGLTNKKITILGKGNVGSRVGKICKAFNMDIKYFRRKDNLLESVKNAEVIIDCLGSNPTTHGLLNKKFFNSLKKGVFFITVTGSKICDINAMINALDKGILAGVAHDAGGVQVGDVYDPFYKKLLKHPKIFVTPHIAYNTDTTKKVSNDMMIDSVEAWIKGKPINILK